MQKEGEPGNKATYRLVFSEEPKLCTCKLVFGEEPKLCTCKLVFGEELKLCTSHELHNDYLYPSVPSKGLILHYMFMCADRSSTLLFGVFMDPKLSWWKISTRKSEYTHT